MLVFNVGNSVVFIPSSFYLRRQIGGKWCDFMCCNVVATLWYRFCCCHALIHHSSAAHKSHFGTGFYGYLTGFSAQRLMQKTGFVCLGILLVCLLCICTNSVLQDLSSSKTTTQTNQGFVFMK